MMYMMKLTQSSVRVFFIVYDFKALDIKANTLITSKIILNFEKKKEKNQSLNFSTIHEALSLKLSIKNWID